VFIFFYFIRNVIVRVNCESNRGAAELGRHGGHLSKVQQEFAAVWAEWNRAKLMIVYAESAGERLMEILFSQ
jgi:hypothetical protein